MKNLGLILIVLGISLLIYSFTFETYTNQKDYEEAYYALEGENKSVKFYELRDTYLTKKYALEDYGVTTIVLGLFSFIFFFKGWNSFKIPKNKSNIAIIGILAVIVTVFGYVGELFLEMNRGGFPHWADSLGIPLAGVPIMFIILSIWYALNLIGLINPFKTGGLVKNINLNSINYWFLIILSLTMLLTVVLIFVGHFWLVTAGILWSYYYLCLLIGRRDGIIENNRQLISSNIENLDLLIDNQTPIKNNN